MTTHKVVSIARIEVIDGMPLTAVQIDALEARIYPHRRAAYAEEFAALRAGRRPWEQNRPKPMSDRTHGEAQTYVAGCRCSACRGAAAAYQRQRRKLKGR